MLAFKSILISQGCCNKLPQTGCLTTAEIYSLMFLKGTSLKSMCQQGPVSAEGFKGCPSLPLPASGSSKQSLAFLGVCEASLQSLSPSSHHHWHLTVQPSVRCCGSMCCPRGAVRSKDLKCSANMQGTAPQKLVCRELVCREFSMQGLRESWRLFVVIENLTCLDSYTIFDG